MNEGDKLDTQQPDTRRQTDQVDQRTGIDRWWLLFEGWHSAESMEWNLEQLPCKHKGNNFRQYVGIIMMVIAVFAFIEPGFSLIKYMLNGGFKADLLFPVLISIGFFLLGLAIFFVRIVTEFDGKTFRYRRKSIFGSMAWDAPLSEYEGVLARSEYHTGSSGGGSRSPSYTLYIVELIHPNKQRRIKLWQSCNNSSGHSASWEKYCRQLALPALRQDGEGYARRDIDDLDKSVRELAGEGKLEATFDSVAAVPEELELNIQGDQLEVVICKPKVPLRRRSINMLKIFSIPFLFILLGFFFGIEFFKWGIFGTLVGMVISLVIILGSITTHLVRINPKGIHILCRNPCWGETQGSRIRADAIKNVCVGMASPSQNFPSVVVETDASNYAIGERLDKDTLEWLKNCILNKIATE